MNKIVFIVAFIFLVMSMVYPANALTLKLNPVVQIGDGTPTLYSIASVCEDNQENIYVLDYKAYKVHKFSPDGKFLLSFGQKGEGPGDLRNPYRIFCSINDEIAVADMMSLVSFFSPGGKYLRKFNLSSKVGFAFNPMYAGENLIYYEKSESNGSRKQNIFNMDGKNVQPQLFVKPNINVVVEGMNYFYSSGEYSPSLVFSYFNGYSVAALSNKYEFIILDQKGKILKRVNRDIQAQKINDSERKYLERQITEIKNLPANVKRTLIDRIPTYKNYFYKILLSGKNIFAFRIKEDITDSDGEIPVDIFSLSGEYLGKIEMEQIPILISQSFMYFKSEDDSEDVILKKFKYQLM